MNFDLLHPADQLVMLMERIYQYGMTTTSGGNLSILDDNGDIFIEEIYIDETLYTEEELVELINSINKKVSTSND